MATKTFSAHDLRVHAWWTETQIYSDYFFDMTATLKFDAVDENTIFRFQELRMIRLSFEEADFPPCATSARTHLLNSMSQVMEGFKAFVAGNVDVARTSMSMAQDELYSLEDELYRLGVTVLYVKERLH